ncbi:MAG TPA: tetratricopeptide repeat protein [Planctomycetota bacterium]|nr:tetratricopeptide repeat protein [Planctomycetota bacterium]
MTIRKEQVLALLALLVSVWVARQYLEEPPMGPSVNPRKLEYTPIPVPASHLVTTPAPALVRTDLCTEPSETRPLPPRELAFPPRPPLSLAGLLLDPGPDYGHLWLLREDGTPVEGVVLQSAGEAAPNTPAPAVQEPDPNGETQAQKEERAARTLDRIYAGGQQRPFFGRIDPEGHDLYALEESGDFEGVELRMRLWSLSGGKFGNAQMFGTGPYKIDRIVLAGTLRNEVNRRVRKVKQDGSNQPELRALVLWLIEKAREDAWVYDEAQQYADLYYKLQGGDVDGLRLRQRVLRARGDLAGELEMLEGITGPNRESAFRYEALGVLKARLCLYADAEQDLRRAAQLAPTDARPHATLAEFLRQRGRSGEALVAAKRADQAFGSVQDADDCVRVARAIVGCELAVGDLEAARAALRHLGAEQAQPYLEGCIAYAAGQTAAALASFRQASATADSGAALLGQAACLLRDQKWQEAHDLFLRVADQEPLLRHRADTGLALLALRTSQLDQAQVWVDRALEANPQDPYAYYLRARTLRLSGQLQGAEEAVRATLKLRDDFVHAIAEMAALQAARAREGRGEEQAQAALSARRYGDRAVDLADKPAVELYELQGLYCFFAADAAAATAAFQHARDLAATEPEKLFAKGALAVVDYSRGLVDDSADMLQKLARDLPKDDPMRTWADATVADIEDHAQKEMLGDGFDRTDPGGIWEQARDGQTAPAIVGGWLTLSGPLSKTGPGEVYVDRIGAIKNGKNFLAVSVTMQVGNGQPLNDGFAGLRIEMQRDFRIQFGIRDGKPLLLVEDGQEGGQPGREQIKPELAGFDVHGEQELELRVVPHDEDRSQNRTFTLLATWNGVEVHRRDLKTLTANTRTELKTVLFAGGSRGNRIDVKFDDYRLERRKE